MLWTTQEFHSSPFEKEIDLERKIAQVRQGLSVQSRVHFEINKRTVIVAVALAAAFVQAPLAEAQTPAMPEARELVIGTKVAPPIVVKAEDCTWRGISIDLWRHIADQIHLRYRFKETTLKALTDGVADGTLDASVAALTVTGPRQRVVDFTQPFYIAGLGIAVPSDMGST